MPFCPCSKRVPKSGTKLQVSPSNSAPDGKILLYNGTNYDGTEFVITQDGVYNKCVETDPSINYQTWPADLLNDATFSVRMPKDKKLTVARDCHTAKDAAGVRHPCPTGCGPTLEILHDVPDTQSAEVSWFKVEPYDPCTGVDCGAHGLCSGGICTCKDGYTGEKCDTPPPDPCAGVDCGAHGSCSGGTCTCRDGYTGVTCDTPPDKCLGVNCGVNGSCVNGLCVCKNGFTGLNCQTPPDKCAGINCGAHGSCVDGKCKCRGGYRGDFCQTDPICPCKNRGRCQCTCRCNNGYGGFACQNRPSNGPPATGYHDGPCDANGAKTGGHDCGDNKNGQCVCSACTCTSPYHGQNCDLKNGKYVGEELDK